MDLFCIKKSGTGTKTTELHVLSASSGYQEFSVQIGTVLHETNSTFAFAVAQNGDLFAIKKSGTGTGSTEIHVLSAATAYRTFLHQGKTALHETDETFEFEVAPNRDIVAIKKSNTGTNRTEVHILSAASNYQQFSLQTGTGLHETDDTFTFAIGANGDLFAIKKSNTGTNRTEVHILSAASNYQQFSLQTGTALHETDETFEFEVAPNRDIVAIKKSNTGTNRTEVHILSAASNYQQFSLQTGTGLHETDDTFEFSARVSTLIAPNLSGRSAPGSSSPQHPELPLMKAIQVTKRDSTTEVKIVPADEETIAAFATAGGTAGAALGSVIPGVGTVAGAAVGTAVGTIVGVIFG
ncbi:hypothetical protein U2F10_23780 [Leptothoe sp. EHU-05/26/07-4]